MVVNNLSFNVYIHMHRHLYTYMYIWKTIIIKKGLQIWENRKYIRSWRKVRGTKML